ncbi:hypothetical protein KOW79_008327 [Hemibagrus wyckioides]|uniref:Uncharacterized protein n=1 Tax=Hemibagrus wyckioides TaxID=337641 RepID=A0A9D3SR20_9TELE|nr:hypothetical protein KOW79_008327 [Hemibagrus wyckioides]
MSDGSFRVPDWDISLAWIRRIESGLEKKTPDCRRDIKGFLPMFKGMLRYIFTEIKSPDQLMTSTMMA